MEENIARRLLVVERKIDVLIDKLDNFLGVVEAEDWEKKILKKRLNNPEFISKEEFLAEVRKDGK